MSDASPLDDELAMSVPEWLIAYPEALRHLEQLGIDYSCGGKSLETALRDRGLDPHPTLRWLHSVLASSPNE